MPLGAELRALTADIVPALDELPVNAYLVDATGQIRWVSEPLTKMYGDVRGRLAWSLFAPEDQARIQTERSQKMLGLKRTSDFEATLLGPDGSRRPVEIASVALEDGYTVVGIFGVIHELGTPAPPPHDHHLTPRQLEVLRLLGNGYSTRQIAEAMHVSVETVRSHVRGVLTALGAHSRLEAIAHARAEHLV